MARLIIWGLPLSILIAVGFMVHAGGASDQPTPRSSPPVPPLLDSTSEPPQVVHEQRIVPEVNEQRGMTCRVYSLSDFRGVPQMADWMVADWIVKTLPKVVAPGTWKLGDRSSKKNVLIYDSSVKLLVVYHTAEVQAEVKAFLQQIETKLPREMVKAAKSTGTVQATYSTDTETKGKPESFKYPIDESSSKSSRPKHLFHFIIRYEGAGIIDENVVKLYGGKAAAEAATGVAGVVGSYVPAAYAQPAVPYCPYPAFTPPTPSRKSGATEPSAAPTQAPQNSFSSPTYVPTPFIPTSR